MSVGVFCSREYLPNAVAGRRRGREGLWIFKSEFNPKHLINNTWVGVSCFLYFVLLVFNEEYSEKTFFGLLNILKLWKHML